MINSITGNEREVLKKRKEKDEERRKKPATQIELKTSLTKERRERRKYKNGANQREEGIREGNMEDEEEEGEGRYIGRKKKTLRETRSEKTGTRKEMRNEAANEKWRELMKKKKKFQYEMIEKNKLSDGPNIRIWNRKRKCKADK